MGSVKSLFSFIDVLRSPLGKDVSLSSWLIVILVTIFGTSISLYFFNKNKTKSTTGYSNAHKITQRERAFSSET